MSNFLVNVTIGGIRSSDELFEAVAAHVEAKKKLVAPAFSADHVAGEMSVSVCVDAPTEEEAQRRVTLELLDSVAAEGAIVEWSAVSMDGDVGAAGGEGR